MRIWGDERTAPGYDRLMGTSIETSTRFSLRRLIRKWILGQGLVIAEVACQPRGVRSPPRGQEDASREIVALPSECVVVGSDR